jgi:predicted Zn-dependent protease
MMNSIFHTLKRLKAGAAAIALASLFVCAAPFPSHGQSLASQIEQQSQMQYRSLLQQAAQHRALAPEDNAELQRLRLIHQRLLPFTYAFNPHARTWQWEVNLIGSKQINAFCMPGGKIAFFTGILRTLNLTDDEVAVVMGHEISHALREHGVERYKKQLGGQVIADVGGAVIGQWLGIDPRLAQMGTRGVNQLFQLKFSRTDETEADAIGLELAARAGFDPRAGIALWRKMAQASRGAPPEWLSTHPAGQNRIREIQAHLPQVMPLYARAAGKDLAQLPPYQMTPLNGPYSPSR